MRDITLDLPDEKKEKEDPSRVFFVRWFASTYDKADGLVAQELVGSGRFEVENHPRETTQEVVLLDVAQRPVATLAIRGSSSASSQPPATSPHVSSPIHQWTLPHEWTQAEAAWTRANAAISSPRKSPNHRWATKDTPQHTFGLNCLSHLPILWYPLHATHMKWPRGGASEVTRVWDHWIRVAQSLFAEEDQGSPWRMHKLLVDVLSLPSLGWVYRSDTLNNGEETDNWVSLWSHPQEPGLLHAFDCEDGTKALLELFNVLITTRLDKSASSTLCELQTLAQQYRAWMAVGELKSEDGGPMRASTQKEKDKPTYRMHCFLLLQGIDSTHKHRLPPLTIESTARFSNVWVREQATEDQRRRDETEYARREACADAIGPQAGENAHLRVPLSLVVADRMYGRVVSLAGVDPRPHGFSTHVLFTHSVDLADLLLRDTATPVEHHTYSVVHKMPTQQLLKLFSQSLSLLPPSVFPSFPLEKEILLPMASKTDISIPAIPRGFPASLRHTRIPLTSGLSLCLIHTSSGSSH